MISELFMFLILFINFLVIILSTFDSLNKYLPNDKIMIWWFRISLSYCLIYLLINYIKSLII